MVEICNTSIGIFLCAFLRPGKMKLTYRRKGTRVYNQNAGNFYNFLQKRWPFMEWFFHLLAVGLWADTLCYLLTKT